MPARVPLHPAWKYIGRYLQAQQSHARLLLLASLLVGPRHQVCPTGTTSWISRILQDRATPGMAPTRNARKSTRLHSSAPYVPSASHELTICGRICALTLMSVRLCAAFAGKHSPVSTIENVMKAYTPARRSLFVVATSRKMVTGVAVDASLVQMRLGAISGPKLAVSAYVHCSKKKRKRRAAGTVNNRQEPMATACLILCRRIMAA